MCSNYFGIPAVYYLLFTALDMYIEPALLLKYTNEHSRFLVMNNNHLLHYRDEGTGYPVLCLHGAFSSLHTFNSWAKRLTPHFRIIRFDMPGFGLTGAIPENDYTIGQYLHYIDEFLTIMHIDKCHVVGSSLGGWMAWEYALARPERVDKLMLIDSAGFLDIKSVPTPFMLARIPLAGNVMKIAARRDLIELFLHQVYFHQEKITEKLVDRYFDLFTRPGNQEAFYALVNQRFKDNTHYLRRITQPTLVMWGEQDKWLPVENAHRFLNLIPHSEGIIYQNAGHIPMEEIPSQTAVDAIAFLK